MATINIILMASCINEKYIKQCENCLQTWIKRSKISSDIQSRCKVFLFGGLARSPRVPELISLPGVKDDHQSATDKQWYGLKWCFDNHPADFYLVGGTDNYLFPDRILKMLKDHLFNGKTQKLLIGGDVDVRNVPERTSYLSGGAGIIVTHLALKELYHIAYCQPSFIDEWPKICHRHGVSYLIPACDVAICYLAHQLNISIVMVDNLHGCNWKGMGGPLSNIKCCNSKVNLRKMLSCHYMDDNMLPFHQLVENYYSLEAAYENVRTTSSDIWEHIPTFYKYAKEIGGNQIVIECGVRSCASTWAFLKGLVDAYFMKTSQAHLIGVDLVYHSNLEKVKQISNGVNVKYDFVKGNSITVPLPVKQADLVFIDTWHVYGQLKRELARFAPIATKYIILHGTSVDAEIGETIRMGWDAEKQSKETGIPIEEINLGVWSAVTEFLKSNSNFILEERYLNNNGLTILKRIT